VEVRWRSLFRSISIGKRCTTYNAPPTSRKRAAVRWSLRNFMLRSSLSWLEKPRNRTRRNLNWLLCSAWKSWIGGTPLEHPPYSPDLAWMERCKKCIIACQGRYFEKEAVTAPPRTSQTALVYLHPHTPSRLGDLLSTETTLLLPYLTLLYPPHPERLRGPPNLLSSGHQGLFPWG
jgi:hypothetical protein